ncbi:hypothetical protein ABXV18_24490 [Vibrio owensii]|uniref:hypothetical protein n=1 Tax=Vibrio owensii TaxID=696485 RepID=UPI0033918B35
MSKAVQILRHVAQNKALLSSPLTKFYANEVDERTSEVLHALMAADDQQIDFALLITSDVDGPVPAQEVSREPVIEEAIVGELVEEPTLDEKLDEFDTRLDDRLRDKHGDETVEEARSDEMAGLIEDIDEDLEASGDSQSFEEFDKEVELAIQEHEEREAAKPKPDDELAALERELEELSVEDDLPDAVDSSEPLSQELDEDDLDLDSLLDDLEG